jgi:Restriction endonuclease
MRTTVPSTQVLILAAGDTPAAQANARGHLFEEFVAQFMALFGYERPTRSTLNNTANGIELDVTSKHVLTRQRMLAECKAYSSPIEAKELAAFYGKLGVDRFESSDSFGYFVAIPGFTKSGRELQGKLEANDSRFRAYAVDSILAMLLDREKIAAFSGIASEYQAPLALLSDEALLVTQDGLFYAAKELSPATRVAVRILVYPTQPHVPVPPRVIELLSNASSYTTGLPCAHASNRAQLIPVISADDTVIEVTGSSSDFEYQLPAAPKYFVGRQHYVSEAEELLGQFRAGLADRAKVLVLNAQSGWGKSSLALRLIDLAQSMGGHGACIDCRTASHPTFVSAAMRHALLKAQDERGLTLPASPSFASVKSTLETLRNTRFISGRQPLCIVFDQFENVFQNALLTREFRDLALGITELPLPVLVGFSWKTDFVAFTESYPYQLRDDIRSRASVFALPPFGPTEIGELIGRLQRSCGQKIHPYLRERIREYSQGLPWLFKKLGSHIIREIKAGVTQDELLAEVLNIQTLFESDVNGLTIAERQALKAIARRAPLAVTDAVELATGDKNIVQSLVTQRLLVSVGEKLDVYWDVFRDYLNQGSVPIQDSYILRLTPNSISKLLIVLNSAGRPVTTGEAAKTIGTSAISVLNMARDLRQLGVLAAQEGVLRFADDVASASNVNVAIKDRAAAALKRHRVYSLLTSLAPATGRVLVADFADALPKAYPAVAAKKHTWANYARAFAYWFQFAGLAAVERDEIILGQECATTLDLMAPGKKRAIKGIVVFPRAGFEPILKFLRDVSANRAIGASNAMRKALADAKTLGLVVEHGDKTLVLSASGGAMTAAKPEQLQAVVRQVIQDQPAFRVGKAMLAEDSGATPRAIGQALARELKVDWAGMTTEYVGKHVRNWMRAAGFKTTIRPVAGTTQDSARRRGGKGTALQLAAPDGVTR